ncbi:MAG TPA: glycosyltransferase [Candidatus Sulfotelmatobacter sp.]|jgi:glycosyltransferase involved in cell wall biosynthesis
MTQKLLLVSDSASCHSGLGRITRDLATRIHADLPEFEVATAGFGGPGNKDFGWPEYHFHELNNFMPPELPMICQDFAGDEELIVLCIWDPSRLRWFANPDQCPMPMMRQWLKVANIRKWIYAPIDAEGPNGKLSVRLQESLAGFERVLNYSKWSAGVTGYPDFIPHGLDTEAWRPRDKSEAKKVLGELGFHGLKETDFLVGMVATNQARKNYALGIQTCRILLERGLDVKVWVHIDSLERHWNIISLVEDYGLQGRVMITTSNFTDMQMRYMYSACNVTLGIGLGEGFGYPIFESMLCGTPCVHGNYGGAAEHLPSWMKVDPIPYAWFYESPYCNKRPVYLPEQWAAKAEEAAENPDIADINALELDWSKVWPKFKSWLKAGLR